MFVTSSDQRKGILVAVITGGRPSLKQRPTAKYLSTLKAAGLNVCWVMNERDAAGYERDDNEVITYTQDWAYRYAKDHWMRVEQPDPDGFFGAFPGREWACRTATERGYWGVLQLDDNIIDLALVRGTAGSKRILRENGEMALFADLLAAISLSTNAMTVGGQLTAVNPSKGQAQTLVRAGFPYSLFLEKTGPDREEWYGPYEDDITHSFQYGNRADGVTAAVMPLLAYKKESKSKTGMRAKYDSTRAVQLQRIMPQSAKLGVRMTTSNGRGNPRVFHTMTAGAIRNPVTVLDEELFGRTKSRVEEILAEWFIAEQEANRMKVMDRASFTARAKLVK